MADFCPDCGAYWSCEHRRTPADDGLSEVAPDSPTWAQLHGPAWQQPEPPDMAALAQSLVDALSHGLGAALSAFQPILAAFGDRLREVAEHVARLLAELEAPPRPPKRLPTPESIPAHSRGVNAPIARRARAPPSSNSHASAKKSRAATFGERGRPGCALTTSGSA